jgi:DNA-directed RNA polymerase omega subunit
VEAQARLFKENRLREAKHLMPETNEKVKDNATAIEPDEQWPGIDSMYRLIVVAALRNKQLLRGAHPRIEADTRRRRNTSIALEEVKRGLVPFTITVAEKKKLNGHDAALKPDDL